MEKRYRFAVAAGRFMPWDEACETRLAAAADACERVCLMLLAGGVDEYAALRVLTPNHRGPSTPAGRFARMKAAAAALGNVDAVFVNIGGCRTPGDEEDPDAEAVLIRSACPRPDAVWMMDASYTQVLQKAYPDAEIIQS